MTNKWISDLLTQMYLANTKIILAITGSIAAYKTPDMIRHLKNQGAEIKVVLSKNGAKFVSKLSLQVVSNHPIYDNLWDKSDQLAMNHIQLARWADMILIAPASANIIAKLTYGICDDLLTNILLATNAKIILAPAMNTVMWHSKTVLDNINKLKHRLIEIIPPIFGELACKEEGLGKLADINTITKQLIKLQYKPLAGINILISLGATIEDIDPVRFISNNSSGKMGLALANICYQYGANLTVISANTKLPNTLFKTIYIRNTKQLLESTIAHIKNKQLFISAVAVTDYTPIQYYDTKIKNTTKKLTIELTKNKDILKYICSLKNRPFCVGFAAETNNLLTYATKKLDHKKCDLIIANDVSRNDIGFNSNENEIYLIDKLQTTHLTKNDKDSLAKLIINHIITKLKLP